MINIKFTLVISVFLNFILSACSSDLGSSDNTSANKEKNTFNLVSTIMENGGNLPVTYTCDGDSISPPVSWDGAPEGTEAYALIMHHIAGPGDAHWYWVMYNIDADVNHINSGETQGTLGNNSVNRLNKYAPPCSKGPGLKAYTLTLYALSEAVDLKTTDSVDRDTLLHAIKNITLASSELVVNYERRSKADSERCKSIKQSVNLAGFDDSVRVTCNDEFAFIASNTYPEHDLMNGITGTNEQIPVPATQYSAPIKITPQIANKLTTIDAALGVAVNGVPIYDYSSHGELDVYNYSARKDTILLGQLDDCGGHAGRGDDYHYHASPDCMISAMNNAADDPIIGWAYDGYPIYGNNNPDGSPIADNDLDVCNGQADDTFGYRYHASSKPPYIIQCLVGEVDTRILPRVSPLSSDTPSARSDLRPPANGVKNLTHTIAKDGTRSMTYDHNGNKYYVTYRPSKTQKNCYDFEQKTVSNGGKIETGTFCRENAKNQNPPPRPPKPSNKPSQPSQQTEGKFKLEVWADNWFAAYLEHNLIIEDSVSIHTERSFNAETTYFSGDYPLHLNFILKDFKENDTGLEYIGKRNQQMGDGGFIAQIMDTTTNQVIGVSNKNWKCHVIHKAPLDKSCESSTNPTAGVGACTFTSSKEPIDWKAPSFDDSLWTKATEYTASDVRPKGGYNNVNWNTNAQFIWGPDLETDNTLLCRVTIEKP